MQIDLDNFLVRERIAELMHDIWINWSKTIVRTEQISQDRFERWVRCWKNYRDLPEEFKNLDREQADKIIEGLKKSRQMREF